MAGPITACEITTGPIMAPGARCVTGNPTTTAPGVAR